MPTPTIPEYITVHLGDPNEEARNVTIPFVDYIKNVASSEIYPTWPDSALRANILAIITYALNRIYTEWYRSAGYNFDITNSTEYDQSFIEGRETFDSIDNIVDKIFNSYITKEGRVDPYFTQYCSGLNSECAGLSQWGTVDLAEKGFLPYEILKYYYGDDTGIISNVPVKSQVASYPGIPLKLGSAGEEVRILQRELNRISNNYPAINKIPQTNSSFGVDTQSAVEKFQEIFNLPITGVVDESTWYKIKYIYTNVKGLAELYSEGVTLEEVEQMYKNLLKKGDQGDDVKTVQYYLTLIGSFDDNIPSIPVDGVFGDKMEQAVVAFQRKYELTPDGKVGRETWNKITQVYETIISDLPSRHIENSETIYPGRFLSLNIQGDDVETLQKLLSAIAIKDSSIPNVQVTGTFDTATFNAVQAFKEKYNLSESDVVGPIVWNKIVEVYNTLNI